MFAPLLLPVFLYAETHYRFPFFFSFLSKAEPELLADAPHRLEPGRRLPILLLAKDAHRFPSVLVSADAVLTAPGEAPRTVALITHRIRLDDRLWWTVCDIDVGVAVGWVAVDVRLTLEINGTTKTYHNDNLRTSNHSPLQVYVSPVPLPSLPGLRFGEAHAHSAATDDQVEFGVPTGAGKALGRSMGLTFWCVTDHSYDLDDRTDSYLDNHPDIPKWRSLQSEIDLLNDSVDGFVIVRGEEVTVRNHRGKNVHCLVYGDREYHPGSGDSAEHWLHTRSELSLGELLKRISPHALAFGAHVRERVPILQRLLLGRDVWHAQDMAHSRLSGVQFWNGSREGGWEEGKQAWITQLLAGRKCIAVAGNDAHGNFNRFRQIGIPFLRIAEADHQLFGRVRTGVFTKVGSEAAILRALAEGRSIMTDGPAAMIADGNGELLLGTHIAGSTRARITAVSSPEFGILKEITLISGTPGFQRETVVERWSSESSFQFEADRVLESSGSSYYRLEVITSEGRRDGRQHMCLTNPVWCASSKEL